MALYITNPEADELARELSAATGETITETVIAALRERRDRLRNPSQDDRIARLREISKRAATIIGATSLDFDELYDNDGLPK